MLSGSTGDITFLSNTTNNISTGIFEINYETSMGYFIANNIVVGLSYSLETESTALTNGSYEYVEAKFNISGYAIYSTFFKDLHLLYNLKMSLKKKVIDNYVLNSSISDGVKTNSLLHTRN